MQYWDSTPFGEPILDPLFPSGMQWEDVDAVDFHQRQGFCLLAGSDLDESKRSVVVSKWNLCDADSSSSESSADDSDEKGEGNEVEDNHGEHDSFRGDAADKFFQILTEVIALQLSMMTAMVTMKTTFQSGIATIHSTRPSNLLNLNVAGASSSVANVPSNSIAITLLPRFALTSPTQEPTSYMPPASTLTVILTPASASFMSAP